MSLKYVSLQPAHLSEAQHCRERAAQCEQRAKEASSPAMAAMYRTIAARWLRSAETSEAVPTSGEGKGPPRKPRSGPI
jgi:hypothetical protein